MQVQNVSYLVREIRVGFHLVEIFDHHLVSLPRGNMQWSVTLFLEIRSLIVSKNFLIRCFRNSSSNSMLLTFLKSTGEPASINIRAISISRRLQAMWRALSPFSFIKIHCKTQSMPNKIIKTNRQRT